jgi:mRNA-degrading endonuclease RelE of RelBE toxin-antitoxin system
MEIRFTPEFEKRYGKLPLSVKLKAEKQIEFFEENLLHPSLNVEKLNPRSKPYWSLRVDRKYRIVFAFLNEDVVVFYNIGEHDWIYKFVNRL